MAQTHLIVGAGNMGGALLSSWVNASLLSAKNIVILDPRPGGAAVFQIERGAKHIEITDNIPKSIRTVLLAVKPQLFNDIKTDLAQSLPSDSLILSVMAGVSSDTLETSFPDAAIIRVMPNTPASIGKGLIAFSADDTVSEDQITHCETLFRASGSVIRVDGDRAIDAVTAVSGSGPAYVFHLCEALADAAMRVGLNAEQAAEIARATVIGASALLEGSDRTPGELREAVTSPGGTTRAALDVLMEDAALTELMRRAVQNAFDRAQELSQ